MGNQQIDPSSKHNLVAKEQQSAANMAINVINHNKRDFVAMICQHWFRRSFKDGKILIDDINGVIAEFYSFLLQYQGKFLCENAPGFEILNDNTIQLRDKPYTSAKLDTPIYMDQDAVYFWKFVLDAQDDHQYGGINNYPMSSYDMIGVVSDRCDNIGKCAWSGLIDFYGISSRRLVWRGDSKIPKRDQTYRGCFAIGQIITIELDCKEAEIAFKIESTDQELYRLKLPPRKAWFPAVHFAFPDLKTSVTLIRDEECR